MVLMVRHFLRLLSDSVSIQDPRHLHFFHKSFSSDVLNSSLFYSFSVRFPFFSRSGSSLFTWFILVSSVIMKLMSFAYFRSIITYCASLSMCQGTSDHETLFIKSPLVRKPRITSTNLAKQNMSEWAESLCYTNICKNFLSPKFLPLSLLV